MNEIEKDLKPCPFCGGEAKLNKMGYKEVGFVRCQKCRATNGIITQEHTAIKSWNTRPQSMDGLVVLDEKALIEMLKSLLLTPKKLDKKPTIAELEKILNSDEVSSLTMAENGEIFCARPKFSIESIAKEICAKFGQAMENRTPSIDDIYKVICNTAFTPLKEGTDWWKELAENIHNMLERKTNGESN